MPRDNVQGRVERCVDPSTPWISAAIGHRSQLEMKRLPIGVQDHVKEDSFLSQLAVERHAVRMLAPVRLPDFDAMPGLVHLRMVVREKRPLSKIVPYHGGRAVPFIRSQKESTVLFQS